MFSESSTGCSYQEKGTFRKHITKPFSLFAETQGVSLRICIGSALWYATYILVIFFKYVEGVLKGEKAPDNAVGRKLLDLVNSVPKMSPDEFEKMVNSNMKVSKRSRDSKV